MIRTSCKARDLRIGDTLCWIDGHNQRVAATTQYPSDYDGFGEVRLDLVYADSPDSYPATLIVAADEMFNIYRGPVFSVYYDVSGETDDGEDFDTFESGCIDTELDLRDAVEYVRETRTNECDGVACVEASFHPIPEKGQVTGWITVTNGMEFRTGCIEQRTLHIDRPISAASFRRIVRLCGGKA